MAAPVVGRIIDGGKGGLMMTGSVLTGGMLLFCLSYVSSMTQFFLVWGAIGILFAGSLYEPCFALITRARGSNAKRAIVKITLIAGFASSISFPMAHSLAEDYGWRAAVQVFALIVIFAAAPLTWWGTRDLQDDSAANSQ